MKRLLVLRHAKSSWDNAGLRDFDRPLNERGERDAPFMGKILAERGGPGPDLILSSPAARAKRTAELVSEAAGWTVPLKLDERIYEASPQTLFSVLTELNDEVMTCVIAGHNPGMEGIIAFLTGATVEMPTSSVAIVEFRAKSWDAIKPGSGKLLEVLRPKELKNETSAN